MRTSADSLGFPDRTMLRVKLLGGAVVEGETGPLGGAGVQRKSLAVLGLPRAAGDRGMSRDRILAAVGHRLKLHALVEGSLGQGGPRMRLSVRLIDPADGCHLWSATYERTATDAFAVHVDLTGMIVAGVRAELCA